MSQNDTYERAVTQSAPDTAIDLERAIRALPDGARRAYETLASLPREGRLPPRLDAPGIAARLIRHRWTGAMAGETWGARTRVIAVRAAAGLILFAVGTIAGVLAMRVRAAPESPQAQRTPADAVIRVQEIGSAYFEAVAQLEVATRAVDAGQRGLVREVVLSTLSGAALEAARVSEIPVVVELAETARRARVSVASASVQP